MVNVVTTRKGAVVQEPSVVSMLLNHPLAAWLWLPVRVWLGWQWLTAGW
jgi:thiosulfate dehydrogenase [quinone] large subunit